MLYKLIQSKNDKSVTFGKWYGRAVVYQTMDLNAVADLIQRNCSMKRSDVWAVLTELVEVIKDGIQDSKAVKLDGLGTFKIGISTKGAEKPEEFDASNIKGFKVLFNAETVKQNDSYVKPMLIGCKAKQIGQYVLPEPEDGEGGNDNP